ncbi:hypothetical protein HOD29_00525 [archaeon]|jgi:hypothetical protein|nr:hypothetical protein [Candidatus Woesearchaeota archaeon]MBT4375847.1 hypothetical protein [archaeon]
MVGTGFHKSIRWFVIAALIISAFFRGEFFDYAVIIALIFLILRTPMEYAK